MPPIVALFAWFVLLVALLVYDPARDARASLALWIPTIWMFLLGSRNASQWFGGGLGISADAIQQGNPIDQVLYITLMLLAIGVLVNRAFNWGTFVTGNLALMACLLFALFSVVWSDFPLVAAKRWFRDFGTYLVVLVVLSDPRPVAAVQTLLRRLAYLLVPLSIVLNKYFPLLSKQYDAWSGVGSFVGVTTSKNMLGLLCLICALFFFWDTVTRWRERREKKTRNVIRMNVVFLAMTLWLLHLAHSTTSVVCLLLGCMVIAAAHSKMFQRRPKLLRALIPAVFCLYLVLDFGFGMSGALAEAVGKDPTLTDRTKIWSFLLGMHTNPLLGVGYQSFWLGARLDYFWNNANLGHINEAHNGYLDVYLQQGIIGVSLLACFLIASYRAICGRKGPASSFAVFGLAIWIVLVFYNMSEAAFESGLLFSVFLLSAISVPARVVRRVVQPVGFNQAGFATGGDVVAAQGTSRRDGNGFSYEGR